MDELIATRPGFRYENCANGGHFKGLALARRFTFVTTNDNAGSGINYRQTFWLNSHVCNPNPNLTLTPNSYTNYRQTFWLNSA
jgi:hypothetical protein